MTSRLLTVEEASAAITAGERLLLAGDEALLRALPAGDWIGGTIPYFIGEEGGVETFSRLFCNELPAFARVEGQRLYRSGELPAIAAEAPQNGVSFLIVPGNSKAHVAFAEVWPTLPEQSLKPVVGWVSGVHLSDLGRQSPKVFDGRTREASAESAVVMHVSVPAEKRVHIDIVNLFSQGGGDTLEFEETSFSATHVLANGRKVPFAAYLKEQQADTRIPLVADYYGALINTSFQGVDEATGEVRLYAPVFQGVQYKLGSPLVDYAAAFAKATAGLAASPVFSCNCILNYLYGELAGKKTGALQGPVTFGEIAYQLHNQTLVYVDFPDA